jgi:phage major head subunit gpT-like protein
MSLNARPKWPSLLDPSFRTIYSETEKQFPSVIGKVFNVQSSDKAYEKDTSVSGLGKLVQKPEGDAIVYEAPTNGYPVVYTHLTFAKGEAVTYEMYEDDQYNIIRKAPKRLALAKMRTREQFAADILNFGFTYGGGGSALFNGGDGKALFATDHPLKSGGTQSNYTTADLDEDSLEAGLVAMRATKDNKGELQMVSPDTLIVPPALEKEARILLDSQQRTGTANNDINPYKGKLNLIVWDFLGAAAGGSDTAWFLVDSSQDSLNWFNRDDRGIEGPEYDFDTKTAKWSVVARWSAGFSDWRGIYGSKGDNS